MCQGSPWPLCRSEAGGGETGMQRGQIAKKSCQQEQRNAGAGGSVTQHRHEQSRGQRSAGRTDRAVERRFPRCAEIGLGHNERGEDRPVSLRQMKSGVDGVGDGAREAGLDSLLERTGLLTPKGWRRGRILRNRK